MEKINLNNYEAYFLDYMEGNLSHEEEHDLLIFLEKHPELKTELEEDLNDIKLLPSKDFVDNKEDLKVASSISSVSEENVEALMAASVDGSLTIEEEKLLGDYIKEHQVEEEYRLYQATKLTAKSGITFEKESIVFDETFELTAETVDEWMIASTEGQLDHKQQIVFSAFVEANGLEQELQAYQSAKLKSNPSEQYGDKSELKKRDRLIPLYVRVASVAAAIALLFFIPFDRDAAQNKLSETNNKSGFPDEEVIVPSDHIDPKIVSDINPVKKTVIAKTGENSTNDIFIPQNNHNSSGNIVAEEKTANQRIQIDERDLFFLKNAVDFEIAMIDHETNDNQYQDEKDPEKADDLQTDVADRSKKRTDEVKTEEPFKLITDMAGNAINRDIHFSRDKKVETEEYVAYHFKIGRFEFERKKAK